MLGVPTVTVSNSTREDLAALGFERVFVIPEGLNFAPLDNLPGKSIHPVIVYAGRLRRPRDQATR